MNKHILDSDVQEYIKAHRESSPSLVALKKSPFKFVTSSEIASQIDGWQRAVKKLPTWGFSNNIYYPDKINLEQCSSEHTALVKQTLVPHGAIVVDVTGGFSVDSCYLAQEAQLVVHCELNAKLSEIVKHNAKELAVKNLVAIHTDGVEYVRRQKNDEIDFIYIDPSRRVNNNKVFLIEDCEPNIVELQDMFLQKARYTLIKLSPLVDINSALLQLKHVKLVYVISVDGDCKELLFLQDRLFDGITKISAIRLVADQLQELTFTQEEEKTALIRTSAPLQYLYDPDVAINKAGAFKMTAKAYNLAKLNTNSHLYTSEEIKNNFPGRIFQILKVFPFNEFKKSNTIQKANVAAKNFPMKVDEIRKKFKIKDGGNDFLYFSTDPLNNYIVIHCTKI